MILFDPTDLRTQVYRNAAPVGTAAARPTVAITHLPTGTVVTCDETDSVIANHRLARAELENILDNQMGEPDATAVTALELLRCWYRWWSQHDIEVPLADQLHTKTAAFLAATAVQEGRKIYSPQDL